MELDFLHQREEKEEAAFNIYEALGKRKCSIHHGNEIKECVVIGFFLINTHRKKTNKQHCVSSVSIKYKPWNSTIINKNFQY